MSDRTDDPEDTPYVHQVLYTNDVVRVVSAFIAGLLTVAEPERVRRALQQILDTWQRQVDAFEQMQQYAKRVEDSKKPTPKGGGN